MSVVQGSVLLAENRQAIAQGKRVTKLTFIAFLYIPLSFTTSFFGMNVEQLGTEGVPIWAWAIMTVPVLFLTVVTYFLDVQTATAWGRSVWSRLTRRHPNTQFSYQIPVEHHKSKDSAMPSQTSSIANGQSKSQPWQAVYPRTTSATTSEPIKFHGYRGGMKINSQGSAGEANLTILYDTKH
nr:hypothetical protein CFP56_75651 [Quercus suber]